MALVINLKNVNLFLAHSFIHPSIHPPNKYLLTFTAFQILDYAVKDMVPKGVDSSYIF